MIEVLTALIAWLSGWYNIPFLTVFLFGALLTLVNILGGLGDADINVDVDHGLDPGHGEPGHVHGHTDHDFPPKWPFLGWLGVGKAPASLLLQVLTLSFGLIGGTCNAVAGDLLGPTGWAFPISLGAAVLGSMTATRIVAAGFQRWLPNEAPEENKADRFAGRTGITASTLPKGGMGQVRIDNLYINAFSTDGPIPYDREVWLVRYDITRRAYVAELLPDDIDY